MPEEIALHDRVEKMEKYVRNMRLAVIFIVAFFIYDALTEAGMLGQKSSTAIADTVRTRELLVISGHDASMLRVGTNQHQQLELIIDNEAGERLHLDAHTIGLWQTNDYQQRMQRFHLDADELRFYDPDGVEQRNDY